MLKFLKNKFSSHFLSGFNNNCKHALRLRRGLLSLLKNTPIAPHIQSIHLSRLYIHDPEVALEKDEFCLVVLLSEATITNTPYYFLGIRVFYQHN